MEIQNKYFVINLPEPALDAMLAHTVEKTVSNVRSNNDKTKHIIKLPVGSSIPSILQNKTVYNHDQIMAELLKPEWISNMI